MTSPAGASTADASPRFLTNEECPRLHQRDWAAFLDGLVDGRQVLHILQTHFARHARRTLVDDAVGEIIELERELVGHGNVDFRPIAAPAAIAAVVVRRLQAEPAA